MDQFVRPSLGAAQHGKIRRAKRFYYCACALPGIIRAETSISSLVGHCGMDPRYVAPIVQARSVILHNKDDH